MKVIAIGDPHFQTDNVPEVELFITKLEQLCLSESPNLIIVLGDLLHTHERLHTIPLNLAYNFIDRLRKISEVIILVGNHDMCNNQQFLTTNHWLNGFKDWSNVIVADKALYREYNNIKLVFVPYVPVGKFESALNTLTQDWKKANCIFAHQEFYGCKMGAIVSIEGDRWDEKFPNVVSGHIHDKQNPQKNIYYCGSSMQHSFGDSEHHIIPVFTFTEKKKDYIVKEIDLGLPKKKIVYTDINNLDTIKIPESGDKVKISISGDYEEFKSFKKTKKYKDMIQTGTKVVFKPKKKNEDKNENEANVKEDSFEQILLALITREKNGFLQQAYELVVNNKETNVDDVIFL